MTFHQTNVAAWMLMTVLSSKKSRMHNFVTTSAKQTRDLFCGLFHSPSDSVPWQVEAIGDV